jgi:hypothetical protein
MKPPSFLEMLAALDGNGFVALTMPSPDAAAELAQQLGSVLDVTQVRISDRPTYLASPECIPPHTDHPAARMILWYCNRNDGSGGGANLLIDSKSVIQNLPAAIAEQMAGVQMRCPDLHGIEPTGTHSLFNPATGDVFYAPWLCPAERCDALVLFEREILEAAHQRRVLLTTGDALLIDNSRMLHFRDAVPPNSIRWLTRYWIGEPVP